MSDSQVSPQASKVFINSDLPLDALLLRAQSAESHRTAVVILHGFPSRDLGAAHIGSGLERFGERIVSSVNTDVLLPKFRGCGDSAGDFSLAGWVTDARSTIDYAVEELGAERVWVCGFGTGGAVGLCASVDSKAVAGVIAVATPADFDDWSADPQKLIEYAKEVGAIGASGFPSDFEAWRAELREVKAVAAAAALERPLLVVHGSDDTLVPHFDARLIADAHTSAELRFIAGGGHRLKNDPRAIAVLTGWIARQQLIQPTNAAK